MTALPTEEAVDPLPAWHKKAESEKDLSSDQSFVVVELKLHDPSIWRLDALTAAEEVDSQAAGEYLRFTNERLEVETAEDGSLIHANLVLPIAAYQHAQVEKLLAQKKFDKAGNPLRFTNSYRFVSTTADETGSTFTATVSLAETLPGKHRPILSMIPGTFVQGLLMSYVKLPGLENVHPKLRAGICQEVAQQLTSYLGQLASSRVRGEVSFPTVETRNPEERLRDYRAALDFLIRDLRPLERKTEDDNRGGKRAIITDERWLALVKAVDAKPLTLFFVNGMSVRIFRGTAQLSTNQPHNVHHGAKRRPATYRPWETPSSTYLAGKTHALLTQYYATIPLASSDPKITEAFSYRNSGNGRELDLAFTPIPLHQDKLTKKQSQINEDDLLIPLSFNRDRLGRILESHRFEIAWSRLVRKSEEWYLQLTLRVRQPKVSPTSRILAVSLGLDTMATWSIQDLEGQEFESGNLGPNTQILQFIKEKRRLEWDQKKGRWIGGRRFRKQLEQTSHRGANQLLAFAQAKQATLVVEDIGWVKKSGPDSAANMRFTAWNYGQLRRILEYKGKLAGIRVEFVSGYHTRGIQDPHEKTKMIAAQFIKEEHKTE